MHLETHKNNLLNLELQLKLGYRSELLLSPSLSKGNLVPGFLPCNSAPIQISFKGIKLAELSSSGATGSKK
jgi:hypothetical protein